jgi:hypothetical protein
VCKLEEELDGHLTGDETDDTPSPGVIVRHRGSHRPICSLVAPLDAIDESGGGAEGSDPVAHLAEALVLECLRVEHRLALVERN